MEDALRNVRAQFGQTHHLVLEGRTVKVRRTFPSFNPSYPKEIIGRVAMAERAHADRALDTAERAFGSWSRRPVHERAAFLRTMAQKLRERKFEFNAWLVYEVGKSWMEADADVAEA